MAKKSGQTVPGPGPLELLGLRRRLGRSPLDLFPELRRRYGRIVQFRAGPRTVLLLSDPAAIEQVLITQNQSFVKGFALGRTRRILGDGLLTSEGELWRSERRLLQPAFHSSHIPDFAEEIGRVAQSQVAGWWHQDRRDIRHEMLDITLRAVSQTLLLSDAGSSARDVGASLGDVLHHFVRQNQSTFIAPPWLPTPSNRRIERAARRLDDVVSNLVARRIDAPRGAGDLLDLLLSARSSDGEPLPEQQVRDEVTTILLAGHETTANTLTFALVLLSQNPEVEARLHTELDAVLDGRPPRLADLEDLPYTGAVIQETLRLYPASWTVVRRPVERVEIAGNAVEPETEVLLCQWLVHRDPEFFPDPLAFRPERWLTGETDALPRFAYFPFGGGQRICIGRDFALLEARLILATIGARHRVRLLSRFPRLEPSVTLRPAGHLMAEIDDRRVDVSAS